MRKTAMLLFILVVYLHTYARKIYISSTTGNDNYSFTSAQNAATPWATLTKLRNNLNSIVAGDTIAFKCGDVFPGTLSINRSGTMGNPIVFTSYGTGAKPKFTGTGTVINYLFYAFSQSYLVFDGLEITDPLLQSDVNRTQLSNIQRAVTLDQCNFSVVRNCKMSFIGTGVYLSGGGYHLIEKDTIFDLRMIVNTNDGSQPGNNDDYGANPITLSSSNNTIRNNFLYGGWAQSFDYTWDGGAFEVYDNGTGVNNNKICYNTIYDCMGGFEVIGNCDSNLVYYNKFVNNTSITYFHNNSIGWKFYNNVIVETNVPRFPADFIFGVKAGGMVDLTLKNNAINITTGGIIAITNRFSPFVHTNNVYKLSNNNILNYALGNAEQNTSSAIWNNVTNANPLFWDYIPFTGGALNNNGTQLGLNADFASNPVNNPPDIGILEAVVPVTPLSCAATAGSVKCYGGTALVSVTASGGTAPYNGTGTFTVLAGSYTYTVTDANGQSASTTVTIAQPAPILSNVNTSRIIEYGGLSTVTATSSGGTGYHSYKLNNGNYQTSGIFTGIAEGTDTLYVKDSIGCTATSVFTIIQPPPFTIGLSTSVIRCYGGTAVVSVTGNGGTPPYSGTGNFSVAAGTYNYTIVDSNGVSRTSSISVTQPSAMTVTVNYPPISVNGGTTNVTVTVTGGTGASYTYSLNSSPYQSSNVFNNISAGTYSVIAKDMNGCTKSRSFVIAQPTGSLQCSASAAAIRCSGGNTLVNVTATGGTAPYSGTGTFNVTAGTYSYTVTDAAGSVRTANITVTDPSPIIPSLTADRILENGGTTTITATASGGAGNYNYSLNNGAYQTSGIFPGVYAGADTVYVRDSLGCVASSVISISQPSPLSMGITYSAIRCYGSTSQVTVTANGGTPPYSGTGIFSVAAGTYTYSISDSNGIVRSSSITITQPAALSVSVSYSPISVYGGSTSVSVRVTGGVAPYLYSLGGSVYQSSNIFNNLPAGTYTVFVKDANGCVKTRSFVLSQPANTLQCTVTATPINCNGDSSSVTVSASGGTPPYSGTGTFVVPAGSYSYSVSDASGTVRTSSVSISEPSALTLSLSSSRIIEYGGSATLTAAAGGGSGSFMYSLNNNGFQSSEIFSGIFAGTDTVTVKDSLGCTLSSSITIVQPAPFNILLNATPINCFGGTSTITITGSGGTPPYTGTGSYTVSAGTYAYSIIDSNGVSRSASITVAQPNALSTPVLTQGAAITTYGGSTTVTVTGVTGGTSPYSYTVDNGVYQTSNILTIRGGTHYIYVKDSRGCITSKSIFIKQPLKLFLVKATSPTCIQQTNGMITVRADGGLPSYRYRLLKKNGVLLNTVFVVDSTFSNLAPANYTIRVKDNNGNGDTTSIYVVVPASTVNCGKVMLENNLKDDVADIISEEVISISPNPTSSYFTLHLGLLAKKCKADLFDNDGRKIETLNFDGSGKATFGRQLRPGIYYLRIQDNLKIWSRKLIRL